jgi:hypothetical protein
MRTTALRLSGHSAIGPNGVVAQSNVLTRLAISGGNRNSQPETGLYYEIQQPRAALSPLWPLQRIRSDCLFTSDGVICRWRIAALLGGGFFRAGKCIRASKAYRIAQRIAQFWRQMAYVRTVISGEQYLPGPPKINKNGRNGRPAFNTSLFPEEILDQLGNAKRRNFCGSGIEDFDMTLQKTLRLTEARSLEFRAEAFNALNHAQFYGPASVDGQRQDPSFGLSPPAAASLSSGPTATKTFQQGIHFAGWPRSQEEHLGFASSSFYVFW